MTTGFPDFLRQLGYDKPSPTDKEQTELYAYNPETRSNMQFDFTPAAQYATCTVQGVKREQGWVMLDKEGANDRQDMKRVLNSFEVVMLKK